MALHIARNGQQTTFSLNILSEKECADPTYWRHICFGDRLGEYFNCQRMPDGRILLTEEFQETNNPDCPGGEILLDADESKQILTDLDYESRIMSQVNSAEDTIKALSFEQATGITLNFDTEHALACVMSADKVWGYDTTILLLFALKQDTVSVYKKSGLSAQAFIGQLERLKERKLFQQWASPKVVTDTAGKK